MKRKLLALTVIALSAVYAAHGYAKDDAEEAKKEREKQVELYETKKEGKLFAEGPYWVDLKKINDSRWNVTNKAPTDDSQQLVLVATQDSGQPDTPPNVELRVFRYLQYKQNGNTRSNITLTFKDADMTNISPANLEDFTLAFYETFTKPAKDVIEKDNTKPKKKKIGPAKMYAISIGKKSDEEGRVRMEWYTWIDKEWTYVIEAKLSNRVFEKDTFQDLIEQFVKNIKDVK